ncbi:M16 family metallopeptidase [Desulforhabdus amnigena]|uniref:Peptidase M16 n=1 Tax=Desulforhabdus amnigena TaxID=40218 RepID=A0A9W6FT86_9BACT|nr:pitrilysin family protein [Desulforhabdus amnigena]GLI32616.1 peptidase M16 [Desulforhabdus amnigena]
MTIRHLPGVFFLLFLLASGKPGYPSNTPKQVPQLPASLQASVQRTIASRPGDLFLVLKNGLTVLIRQQENVNVVSSRVVVRTGSIYEGDYLSTGISHYLEHVVSGGSTKSFTEAEAKERLEKMGGSTNAATSYERTIYYIDTSAGHWKDALDLLLSYVSESVLDPQQVEREKAVIQQEIKMGENDPDRELWKTFIQTAYQVHPVRNPVIGYEELFVQLDRDALLRYYSERYRPDNMVVVVAGNVVPNDVAAFVAEKTKNFQRKSSPPVVLPQEPLQVGPRWEEKTLPIARLTQAIVGFPSVKIDDEDLYALDVLALLLGDGRTSRLYSRLKDKENRVLSVGTSNWTPDFVQGQFFISLTLAPQYWPGVLKSVEEEIDRFKKETVTDEELAKAKKSVIAQHVFEKETVSALASSLGSSYLYTADPYFDDAYVERIRQVTPQQIQDVAQRYLSMERRTVAVIQPETTRETLAASEVKPEESSSLKASAVQTHQMQNGLKVLLKQDSTLPLVTIHLYGKGGLLLENLNDQGISSFTASLLTAGTSRRTKQQIDQAIEEVGGSLESRSDNNTYHVSIKVLKDDLDLALDILSDIVQNAQFPAEEIEKKRQETLLAIQRQDENWQFEVLQLFKKNYFQHSAYRNDRLGTAESVQSFTREQIQTFYHRMVNPHQSVLAVYGDTDTSKLLPKIQKLFGSWTDRPLSLAPAPQETHPLKSDRVIEKKSEKSAAALFIGTNGLDIDSSRKPVLDVLDAILSGQGYPGGRLFDALRGGKEDLVYVVGAFPFYGIRAGFFGILTQTTLKNLDKVQEIILANLKRLREEPVSPQELENVKEMLITLHHMELESLDAQSQSAVINEVLGLGWDYDKKYPDLIRSVSIKDIQELAGDLFSYTLIARTLPENPVEILPPPPPKSDVQTP